MNWAQFKDPVSHMCCAGTVVASWSLTQEVSSSSPFDDKYFYRPQTKFAKVMFLQVSVCPQGGVHGCSQGGHAWLLRGACVVSPGGACVVAPGGHAWLLRGGACMVALGGHAWLLWGGVHGFFNEIRSMSGRYASYWNAFLLLLNSLISVKTFRKNIVSWNYFCVKIETN